MSDFDQDMDISSPGYQVPGGTGSRYNPRGKMPSPGYQPNIAGLLDLTGRQLTQRIQSGEIDLDDINWKTLGLLGIDRRDLEVTVAADEVARQLAQELAAQVRIRLVCCR